MGMGDLVLCARVRVCVCERFHILSINTNKQLSFSFSRIPVFKCQLLGGRYSNVLLCLFDQ